MAFPPLNIVSACERFKQKTGTHKDLSQDFFHPRTHSLSPSRVCMVGGIEVIVVHWIHPGGMPEICSKQLHKKDVGQV